MHSLTVPSLLGTTTTGETYGGGLIFWHSFYDAFFFDGVFHEKGNSPLWLCKGNYLFINVELYCVILQFSHTMQVEIFNKISDVLILNLLCFDLCSVILFKLNVTRPSLGLCLSLEDIPRRFGVLYYKERCDRISAFGLYCSLKFSKEFHGYGSVISTCFNVSWLQVDVCHLIRSMTIENIYGCSCIYSHSKLVSLYFHINIRDFFCRFGRVHRVKVFVVSTTFCVAALIFL